MSKIEENMNYFRNMVNGVGVSLGMRHEDTEDLLGEVLVAVMEAEERFDPAAGVEWITFMHHRAQGVIKDYLKTDAASVVPKPLRLGQALAAARAMHGRLQQSLLREPTNREVADALGMSIGDYEEMRTSGDYSQAFLEDLSIEDEEAEDSIEWEAQIQDEACLSGPMADACTAQVSDVLGMFLLSLRPVEAQTLTLLFGLDGKGERTLREAADALEISHMQVGRYRDQAIRKIKNRGLGDALLRQLESMQRGGRTNA